MKMNLECSMHLLVALAMNFQVHAQSAVKVGAETVRVARVSGFGDQAEFLLYLGGSLVLTNVVAWKENGTFEELGEGVADGDKIRMATTLTADSAGFWTRVTMEMPIHKTGVMRVGDTAVLTLPDGKTKVVPLKPGVFPFVGMLGLNLYTRHYDPSKGGKQFLPVLIPHKPADQISVERKRNLHLSVAGTMLNVIEFEVKAAGMIALVWVDENGRLIKSQQVDEDAVFIRRGYEALMEKH